jgi:hypothetical protein
MPSKLRSLIEGDRMLIDVAASRLIDVKTDLLLADRTLDDDGMEASALNKLPELDQPRI